MAYRVTSPNWSGGGSLPSSTPVVLLTGNLLAQVNAAYPGWTSASASGAAFSFFGAQVHSGPPGHRFVVSVGTPGPLGTMTFTFTVDGGSVQGPVTSARQLPNGLLNATQFVFAVPGTSATISFSDVVFPTGAVFSIGVDGVVTVAGAAVTSPSLELYAVAPIAGIGSPLTLQVDSLGAAIAGVAVLISTGIGQGWTLGQVVSDGSTQTVAGIAAPLSASLRAIGSLIGYGTGGGAVDAAPYAIAGRSADGTHIFFSASGVLAFAALASSMTSLGAITPGTTAVVEVAGTTPSSDGGGWRVLAV